jgi:hypothetical protein
MLVASDWLVGVAGDQAFRSDVFRDSSFLKRVCTVGVTVTNKSRATGTCHHASFLT